MGTFFYDDFSDGAHPAVLEALTDGNDGQQRGYGYDEASAEARRRLCRALGVEAAVHFVAGGTLANLVGLAAMLKPFEGVIAPTTGHVSVHETGAIEATGHKVITVEGDDGKLTPEGIERGLATFEDEHTVRPAVAYLTQATERGTVYDADELAAAVAHAKDRGLRTFLDGARLATALANEETGLTLPAVGALGIDVVTVGGTKNGGLFGEAVVVTDPEVAADFRFHLKQRGALLAKGRALGLQFARFFDDDELWLALGRHARRAAVRLWRGLEALGVEFDAVPGANQVFAVLPAPVAAALGRDHGFYEWAGDGTTTTVRLVCSWATTDEQVDTFVADAAAALGVPVGGAPSGPVSRGRAALRSR